MASFPDGGGGWVRGKALTLTAGLPRLHTFARDVRAWLTACNEVATDQITIQQQ